MDTDGVGYEVDFLAVGDGEKSGDAIALRFGNLHADPPEQTVVVIDGGFKDCGSALVQHIRQYYKTNHVDAVVCTHPDNDHASGLEIVLTEMEVGNLLIHLPWNQTQNTSGLFEDNRVTDQSVNRALRESLETALDLEKLARQKRIKIVEPFWAVSGFEGIMRVVGSTEEYYKSLLPGYRGTPEPKANFAALAQLLLKEAKEADKKVAEYWGIERLDDTGETSAENNSSVILLFTIGDESLLFTGDAGILALSEAVERLEEEGFDFSTLNFV